MRCDLKDCTLNAWARLYTGDRRWSIDLCVPHFIEHGDRVGNQMVSETVRPIAAGLTITSGKEKTDTRTLDIVVINGKMRM